MFRSLAPVLVLPFLGLAAPAGAQSPVAEVLCEPTGQMYDRLSRRMGQSRNASGIRDREQVMEVWTTEKGTWALVATYATGTSCLLAMGEAWQTLTPPAIPSDPDRATPEG
ncbi:hypothetical protein [Pseudodonghicola flavimaris]|uniref:Uncharacterized protein n=1 Tax=Pseudodonghicola flavimaris TaxID=3050036 RepID=A0ABT7F0G4_9RHOB|nr:hypothetical protein [Pseudodonghicola flavimaris]MDK3018075.1 hypothetical protein [Pseudodonghicola flavimaris]